MAINTSARFRLNFPIRGRRVQPSTVAPTQVLIVQSNLKSAQTLTDLFTARGEQVWQATHAADLPKLVKQHRPDWVGIDLHLPEESWQEVWRYVRQQLPDAKVFFTTQYLDLPREIQAAERG